MSSPNTYFFVSTPGAPEPPVKNADSKRRWIPLTLSQTYLTAEDMRYLLKPELVSLQTEFEKRGKELRFVGGCVRDLLKGEKSKDIDLCTDATPEEARAIYDELGIKYFDTGIQHGTITVVYDKEAYEITTLRVDKDTDGRHATVEFTNDWHADLARRDLTFNAMSLTFRGELIDPFNGWGDLNLKRVHFVGDASERIREDYLRILRYFRFFARYGSFDPSSETMSAIQNNAVGLNQISRERVWMEMRKLFASSSLLLVPTIELMIKACVTPHIDMPMGDLERLEQVAARTRHPITRLIGYLGVDPGFYFPALAAAWKMSNEDTNLGNYLCKHLYPKHAEYDLKRLIYVEGHDPQHVAELAKLQGARTFAFELSLLDFKAPKMPINGNDLKAFASGPALGDMLYYAKHVFFDRDFNISAADLLDEVKRKWGISA